MSAAGQAAGAADPWTATSEQEPYRVVRVGPCTPVIAELVLEPLDQPLAYAPGQYVLLEDDDGAISPRSYSVANAPRDDGRLSLLVSRVPGGQASTWAHERLAAGTTVRVSGPYGTFVDDPAATGPALYLAGGSGLAPIRALLEAAPATGGRAAATLICSVRDERHVIDGDAFAARARADPRFRFVRTLTRGDGPPPRGRIPAQLGELAGRLDDADVFVAGASGFVTACAAAAEALGAPRVRIHTEVFYDEPRPGDGAESPSNG